MPINRVAKHKHYTRLSNTMLNEQTVSLKAKGLWAVLMSKPDDWTITIGGTASFTKERPDALKPILKELERAGYLERHVVSQGKGKIITVSTLHEEPRFSTVRNDPLEKELSTVPFTADVNTTVVNMGGITTTDIPRPDLAKTKNLKENRPSVSADLGEAASSSSPDDNDAPRRVSLKAKSHTKTKFNDPTTDHQLRPNDIGYFRALLISLFDYELQSEDVPHLKRLVNNHGRNDVANLFRYLRGEESSAEYLFPDGFEEFANGITGSDFPHSDDSASPMSQPAPSDEDIPPVGEQKSPEQIERAAKAAAFSREVTRLMQYFEAKVGKQNPGGRHGYDKREQQRHVLKGLIRQSGSEAVIAMIDATADYNATPDVKPVRTVSGMVRKSSQILPYSALF